MGYYHSSASPTFEAKPQSRMALALEASNGRIIADSGEGYSSESECKKDIDRVKDSQDAAVKME